MEWLKNLSNAIDYIEDNLAGEICELRNLQQYRDERDCLADLLPQYSVISGRQMIRET